jgi:hypothetical protein
VPNGCRPGLIQPESCPRPRPRPRPRPSTDASPRCRRLPRPGRSCSRSYALTLVHCGWDTPLGRGNSLPSLRSGSSSAGSALFSRGAAVPWLKSFQRTPTHTNAHQRTPTHTNAHQRNKKGAIKKSGAIFENSDFTSDRVGYLAMKVSTQSLRIHCMSLILRMRIRIKFKRWMTLIFLLI